MGGIGNKFRKTMCWWFTLYYQWGNISSRFSSNSEKLLENLEEMFPLYYRVICLVYSNLQPLNSVLSVANGLTSKK